MSLRVLTQWLSQPLEEELDIRVVIIGRRDQRDGVESNKRVA
jgi:hypothetical protein